jgi:hypothetical protein
MTRFRLTRPFSIKPNSCRSRDGGQLSFFGNVVSGGVEPGMHLILPKPKGAITTMVIEKVLQGGDSRAPIPGLLSISIAYEDRAAVAWWSALELKAGDELDFVAAPGVTQ